jgi:hypothetical protein
MAGYYCNLRIFKGKAPSTKSQDPRNTRTKNQVPRSKAQEIQESRTKNQAPRTKKTSPGPVSNSGFYWILRFGSCDLNLVIVFCDLTLNIAGKPGITGKNKAPGVFDQGEFQGLLVIVLFHH